MKSSITSLALLAAAPLASASALTVLPDCAESATQAGISSTGCGTSDFKCICGNSQFVTSVHNAIQTTCSVADQQITLAFAAQVCGAVGVAINIPTPSATSSAAPVPSAIETAGSASSSSSASSSAASVPSAIPAPYAFANGSTSINGTNSTIPFTGDAAERRAAMGFQLAGSAVGIAVLMAVFL